MAGSCDAVTKPNVQFTDLLYDHLRGLSKVYRAAGVNLVIGVSCIKFCNKPHGERRYDISRILVGRKIGIGRMIIKISLGILKPRLIFRTEPTLKMDVAGS